MLQVRIVEGLRTDNGLPKVPRTDKWPRVPGRFVYAPGQGRWCGDPVHPARKPNQNADIERFSRAHREELVDQHLFLSLANVRDATLWWMIEYNDERSHDALGNPTPMQVRQ